MKQARSVWILFLVYCGVENEWDTEIKFHKDASIIAIYLKMLLCMCVVWTIWLNNGLIMYSCFLCSHFLIYIDYDDLLALSIFLVKTTQIV